MRKAWYRRCSGVGYRLLEGHIKLLFVGGQKTRSLALATAISSLYGVSGPIAADSIKAENIALGKPVTASSEYGSQWRAEFAVDGNRQTRWSSAYQDSNFLEIDLGRNHNIDRAVVRWERAYPTEYQISISEDRQNWTSVAATDDSDGGVDEFEGLSGTGRYVRLISIKRATQFGVSPWEIELYGARTDRVAKQANPLTKIQNRFSFCMGLEESPSPVPEMVRQVCDSNLAIAGRFTLMGDDGYGQIQLGEKCLTVHSYDRLAPILLEECGLYERFMWVPIDWRWNQGQVILRNSFSGQCISLDRNDQREEGAGFVQDICDPFDERSQLWLEDFVQGLRAKDTNLIEPVTPTFHGIRDFASFHEGTYSMEAWTHGDIAFYAPPTKVKNEWVQKWIAWYSHMDALHRRIWNQDNFDSVYRRNTSDFGPKKVVAQIENGLCSCGTKQQAEALGFLPRTIEEPDNWMHQWILFYEMNRGGPTPNFYGKATWPVSHQGGLILPHLMAGLGFYEVGGPAGLERDVPGDILRYLSAWEHDEARIPLAQRDIPADITMGILLQVLHDQGTDVFIQTLHNMSEKPTATSATHALCDFRDAVNDAAGKFYDWKMTHLWRLPASCGGDNGPVSLSVSDVTVNEGDSSLTVSAQLSQPTDQDVSVLMHTLPGSATNGSDFYGFSRTLNIPGGTTSASTEITLLNDTDVEPTEEFEIRLLNAVNANIEDGLAKVTIEDDDEVGQGDLSVSDMVVNEGAGTAKVTVILSTAQSQPVDVTIHTRAVSAVGGEDYYGFTQDLSFAPGETETSTVLTILNDTAKESEEQLQVLLIRPRNAQIDAGIANISIVDDD